MAAVTNGVKGQQVPNIDAFKFIYNRYTKSRGEPRMYEIFCANCKKLVLIYQKDGSGQLLRCYFDRIHHPKTLTDKTKLNCQNCGKLIGTGMVYKPENRPAYRMIHAAYYKG